MPYCLKKGVESGVWAWGKGWIIGSSYNFGKSPEFPRRKYLCEKECYETAKLNIVSKEGSNLCGTVLTNTGTRFVPDYLCLIREQIVLKRNKFVYHFDRLDSGSIAYSRISLTTQHPYGIWSTHFMGSF